MANNLKIGAVVVLFLAAILAAIFVSTIGNSTADLVNTALNENETLDISGARLPDTGDINMSASFTLVEDDWIDIVSVSMANGTQLTEGTDWNHTTTVIYFTNTSILAEPSPGYIFNTTAVNYSFYPDDYVKQAAARTLINLIPLFFIIGGLLIAVGYLNRDFLKDVFKF